MLTHFPKNILKQFKRRRNQNIAAIALPYLVKIPVLAAYQQKLVVQGGQCVLYEFCSVFCTWCAMYIVQGVLCVLYKFCSVYCINLFNRLGVAGAVLQSPPLLTQ